MTLSSRYDQATAVTAGADGSYSPTYAPNQYDNVEVLPPGITVSNTLPYAAWFTFTQQGTRSIQLQVSNSGRNNAIDLVAFSGGTYTLVASAPFANSFTYVDAAVTDGVLYYVRVSTDNAYGNDFFVRMGGIAPDLVTNHHWYNATFFQAPFSIDQSTGNRYSEPEDYGPINTIPTNNRSAWYTFVATSTASMSITCYGNAGADPRFDFIRAEADGTLTLVNAYAVSSFQTQNTPALVVGTRYYIRVASSGSIFSTYSFHLDGGGSLTAAADPTNHQIANAVTLAVNSLSGFTYAVDNTLTQFADAETSGPASPSGFRGAYYLYTPSSSGTLTVRAQGANGVQLTVYRLLSGTYTTLSDTGIATAAPVSAAVAVISGGTYYIRVANFASGSGQTVSLYGTTPAPIVPLSLPAAKVKTAAAANASSPGVQSPAARVLVKAQGRLIGVIDKIDVGPARVAVRGRVPRISDNLRPASVKVRIPTPMLVEAELVQTQPEFGEVVISYRPQFIVGLRQKDETLQFTIELQYDDDPAFPSPVTLSNTVDSTVGGITVTPTSDVFDTTYWRVRLLLNGVEQIGWSAASLFTVDVSVDPTVLPVTWAIDPTAARPIHLWHFDPEGPDGGDTVTAYGQGFPLTPGRVLFNDDPLVIGSWTLVPPDSSHAGTIDGDTVGPEHFEVTFAAPGAPPGGPITVEA